MSCSPWPESILFFKCSWKSNMNYQTNNLPYIIHFLFTGKILEVCWTNDTFRHLAKLAWGSVKWASYVEPTGMNSLPANIWGTKLRRGKQKRCLCFHGSSSSQKPFTAAQWEPAAVWGLWQAEEQDLSSHPISCQPTLHHPERTQVSERQNSNLHSLLRSSDVRHKAILQATPLASAPRGWSGFTSTSFLEDISFWVCVCMCFPYNFQC